MRQNPRPLPRPLLVLSGWRAPLFPATSLARSLARLVGDERPDMRLGVCFTFCNRFESAIRRVIEAVDAHWPTDGDDAATREIDVVGISMGGLVARAAAAGIGTPRRLRIARLFTLGTPHRGARIARYIRPDPCVAEMAPGSSLLRKLDEALPTAAYELVCYARLRDDWVGAANAAPEGAEPLWKPGPFLLSHQTISADALIRTDIARRLRQEPPIAHANGPPPRN